MSERRKLNDVYTTPCTCGYISIYGVIGSGKTKESVLLKKYAPIRGTDEIEWKHRIGEQWKVLKDNVETEVN